MTQILACCKYCGAQSMWCDVVNSIPCLVKLMTICTGIILLLFVILKYGVEWYRICKTSEAEKAKSSNGTCSIGEDIKKQLSDFANKENQLREDNQVLKKKLSMMEELWGGYKKQLEELLNNAASKKA